MTANNSPDKKPSTLHVLHFASGDLWAGAEAMLCSLAKAQASAFVADSNIKVSVILLNPGRLERELVTAGIQVIVIDESRNNSQQILSQLNSNIKELQPDVVHTHRVKENIFGSYCAWKNGKIPCLRTLHGAQEHQPPLSRPDKWLISFLDWFCGRFYQQPVVAVSTVLAKQLQSQFPESRISLINNGVDINQLAPDGMLEHEIKTSGTFKIGIAGRLTPVKRVDLFISTACQLKQARPELDISFNIYGDGPLKQQLEAQVSAENAASYISFEGHSNNIAIELKELDALLMTSDHEGMPMVLLEAMCLNTPIIAHAVGGIPDLLDQGRCGTLVSEQEPTAFVEEIIKLVEQPQAYQQKTEQAFARVREHYSAEQTAAAYITMYSQIKK